MSEARRVLRQALALGALSVVVAAAVHFPLFKRFAGGEFRETFFQTSEYPGVRLITLEEAEDLWRAGEAYLIDARPADAYGKGHIPRARNVSAAGTGVTLPAEIRDLERERTVVVYCEGGDCQASLALAKRLHGEGFKDIRVMTGGWEEWKKAGLPEEKSDGQE